MLELIAPHRSYLEPDPESPGLSGAFRQELRSDEKCCLFGATLNHPVSTVLIFIFMCDHPGDDRLIKGWWFIVIRRVSTRIL